MTQNEIAVAIVKSSCLRSITIFLGPYCSNSAIKAYTNQCYLKPINKARKILKEMGISPGLYSELEAILDDVSQFVCKGIISDSLYVYNDNLDDIRTSKDVDALYKFNELSNIDRVYEEVKYAIETKLDLLITGIEKIQGRQDELI